jgi:hypothetical protein
MRPYAGSTNVLRAQYIGYKGTNILLDRTSRAKCALKNIDAAHQDFELVALHDFYLIDLFLHNIWTLHPSCHCDPTSLYELRRSWQPVLRSFSEVESR